jgi:hypothetical protein
MCWREKYEYKKATKGNAPLYFGSAMSQALEALHKGQDAEVAWIKGHNHFDSLLIESGAGNLYPQIARGLELLGSYKRGGVFIGSPESEFSITVPRLPVRVVGYRDLKTTDGFIEFKTSKAKWEQERIDEEIQATIYWLGHREETGQDPTQATYVIMPTSGLPNVRLHQTVRTEKQVQEFYELANTSWEQMGSGKYVANPKCPIHRVSPVPRVRRNHPVFDIDA